MTVKNPDLLSLFDELKALLEPYAGRMNVRRNEPGYYDLWSDKPVVIDGRAKKDVYFTGLVIQKSYVGFYYMPVYMHEEARGFFDPKSLATLKDKSCFYIRELTPEIRDQIAEALARGYELYRERGRA